MGAAAVDDLRHLSPTCCRHRRRARLSSRQTTAAAAPRRRHVPRQLQRPPASSPAAAAVGSGCIFGIGSLDFLIRQDPRRRPGLIQYRRSHILCTTKTSSCGRCWCWRLCWWEPRMHFCIDGCRCNDEVRTAADGLGDAMGDGR